MLDTPFFAETSWPSCFGLRTKRSRSPLLLCLLFVAQSVLNSNDNVLPCRRKKSQLPLASGHMPLQRAVGTLVLQGKDALPMLDHVL